MNISLLGMIGSMEIMVIAVIVLILFGAKKGPELMKGVGTGIREFKKASRDVQEELHRAMDEVEHTPPAPTPKTPQESLSQSSQRTDLSPKA